MTLLIKLALALLAVCAIVLICVIFNAQMRFLFKFFTNGALGLLELLLFNYLGSFIGVGLGINVISCLTVGVLGFPGLALLLLLKLILGT